MSSYTSSNKVRISTWLDNAGELLDLPRLDDESLVSYRERLIDHVTNKGNPSSSGLNHSMSREAGLSRKHILTLNALEGVTFPIVKVTSKYFKLYDNETLDIQQDLYNTTIGDLYTIINSTSTKFEVTYYNEDYQDYSATKLFYGSNSNIRQSLKLGPSKLNNLGYTYIYNLVFSSDKHRYSKGSLEEVVDIYDFFLDSANGLLYTGQVASDIISFNYYINPFKIFYTPISFYPLSDEDIDYIIKDTILTEDGEEYLQINSTGAKFINELLAAHPLTWGK